MGESKLAECDTGLFDTVTSFFLAYEYSAVYNPYNTIKFGMATLDL